MPHETAIRQKIDNLREQWDTLSEEIERSIRTMRLERTHLHVIDSFEEKVLAVSQEADFSSDRLRMLEADVKSLRENVRRKLFHEKTQSGIRLDHSSL